MNRTVQLLAVPVVIVLACVALAWWLRTLVNRAQAELLAAQQRPLDIVQTLDVLKLVTHEVTARVAATREHENWRGRVSVEIEAEVQLLFGVDLTNGRIRIERHPSYVQIVVPEPTLLYYNVDTGKIVEKRVKVTGLRTRTGAGQTQVTLCIYEDLPRAIKEQAANEELMQIVREGCRDRIRKLLEVILPGEPWVEVRFESETNVRQSELSRT